MVNDRKDSFCGKSFSPHIRGDPEQELNASGFGDDTQTRKSDVRFFKIKHGPQSEPMVIKRSITFSKQGAGLKIDERVPVPEVLMNPIETTE